MKVTQDIAILGGKRTAMAEYCGSGPEFGKFKDLSANDLGAHAIELHTGSYAHHPDDPAQLQALREAAALGSQLALHVHAGHGLTVRNVTPVAAIREIEELNIGHTIVSRAVFVGIAAAVREMRSAMDRARASLEP